MGLPYALRLGLISVVIVATFFASSMPNPEFLPDWALKTMGVVRTASPWGGWGFGSNSTPCVGAPRRITVGGLEKKWSFGFNYTNWALTNGPFCQNDTLVFQYELPNTPTAPHGHTVKSFAYGFWDYFNCSVSNAVLLANETQGQGSGFEFQLQWPWMTHMFACGVGDGFHCNVGLMKFMILVFPRHCVQFG